MSVKDFSSETGKPGGHMGILNIRTTHLISKIDQEFGDTTHADTSYAHEMDVFGLTECFHTFAEYATLQMQSTTNH
jgi:hypothetical protein